jgi:SAM-dependent methyltransferase
VAQDSSRADFWDTRFRGGITPWDAAGAPPRLAAWLQGRGSPFRVLIPGCGTGYEVRLFAGHGHEVLAIDFSAAAVEAAGKELGEPLARLVAQQDFFLFQAQPFDLVYERAFLCALPRRMWPQWARRVTELVRPGGELAGFFYIDDNERGPPFGVAPHALRALLEEGFELTEEKAIPPEESIPVFKGKEVWQVWRRKL